MIHRTRRGVPASGADRRRLLARVAGGVSLCAACFGVSGCASDPTQGYSTRSSFSEEVGSIAVPLFENQTFSVGIEAQLTEAIIKELRRTTPWVVTAADAGETTLSGTITKVDLIPYSRERGLGLVQEMGVQMTVSFDWVDNRSGKTLVARRNFVATESFVPSQPSGERLARGEQAAIQELARDIVTELRSNW